VANVVNGFVDSGAAVLLRRLRSRAGSGVRHVLGCTTDKGVGDSYKPDLREQANVGHHVMISGQARWTAMFGPAWQH
jgi:hypothetical protein